MMKVKWDKIHEKNWRRRRSKMKKNSRWNCDDEDDGNGKTFLLIRSSMNISTKSKIDFRLLFMSCKFLYASI